MCIHCNWNPLYLVFIMIFDYDGCKNPWIYLFFNIMRIYVFPWILCMVFLVQGFVINDVVVLVLCMKTNNWLRYGNIVNVHISDMSIGHITWSFTKRFCDYFKCCNLWFKELSKKKCYLKLLVNFFKFEYFDANVK